MICIACRAEITCMMMEVESGFLLVQVFIGFVYASDYKVNITDARFCKQFCYPSAFATSCQVYPS